VHGVNGRQQCRVDVTQHSLLVNKLVVVEEEKFESGDNILVRIPDNGIIHFFKGSQGRVDCTRNPFGVKSRVAFEHLACVYLASEGVFYVHINLFDQLYERPGTLGYIFELDGQFNKLDGPKKRTKARSKDICNHPGYEISGTRGIEALKKRGKGQKTKREKGDLHSYCIRRPEMGVREKKQCIYSSMITHGRVKDEARAIQCCLETRGVPLISRITSHLSRRQWDLVVGCEKQEGRECIKVNKANRRILR
jgi:hypothetical protein